MTPKVSVIIPNYNHEPYLQERLDSVFNQTYQDFEVILLDDASTDGSEELLLNYKNHPKVAHLIINKENSGSPFKQWQKGIELAQGEYIWIAESDDYCELNFLELLINFIYEYENAVLVYCASNIIDEKENNLGRHKWADALDNQRWTKDFKNDGKNEIKNYLRYRNTITNSSSVLFKRNVALKINFPYSMKFCGDWYIWIQLLEQGGLVYLSNPLNYFRRPIESTRTIKKYQLEKSRFKEYFFIIKQYSSLTHRLIYRRRYNWILRELEIKIDKLKLLDKIKFSMPLDLLLLFTIRRLKK